MLDLPRSIRLATWAAAVRRGDTAVPDAVAAVQGQDEPHEVAGDVVPVQDLTALVEWVVAAGVDIQVALPVPGHLLGLPGPADLNEAALEAGECVLLGARPAAPAVGLVPEVTVFGSWLEPGATVTWRGYEAAPRTVTDHGNLSEAERALREALMTATEALADLDVARWREDAGDRIAGIRDGGLDRRVVPGSTPPRALRVLATAARVRAIVEMAAEDDGASVTGWEAGRRSAVLREVDQVARRAMVSAVNLPG